MGCIINNFDCIISIVDEKSVDESASYPFPLVHGNNCELHSRFHGIIHFRDKQLITSFQKFNGQDGGNLPIK